MRKWASFVWSAQPYVNWSDRSQNATFSQVCFLARRLSLVFVDCHTLGWEQDMGLSDIFVF